MTILEKINSAPAACLMLVYKRQCEAAGMWRIEHEEAFRVKMGEFERKWRER